MLRKPRLWSGGTPLRRRKKRRFAPTIDLRREEMMIADLRSKANARRGHYSMITQTGCNHPITVTVPYRFFNKATDSGSATGTTIKRLSPHGSVLRAGTPWLTR